MTTPQTPRSTKLDADDLELLIRAIEGLSAKIDAIGNNAPMLTQAQAAQVTTRFVEATKGQTFQYIAPVLAEIKTATGKLEQEATNARVGLMQDHRTDTEKLIRDNRWWRFGAVGAVFLILASAWLGHGFFVRTVSGCYFLNGYFYHAKIGSGDPSFCYFDR